MSIKKETIAPTKKLAFPIPDHCAATSSSTVLRAPEAHSRSAATSSTIASMMVRDAQLCFDDDGSAHTLVTFHSKKKVAIRRDADHYKALLREGLPLPLKPPAKYEQEFVQSLSDLSIQKLDGLITRRTGWCGAGYVTRQGLISFSENAPSLHFLGETPYPHKGSLESWKANVGPFIVNNTIPLTLVGWLLSGALLREHGVESGFINLFGQTSKGKSTCANLAASIMGPPDGNGNSAVNTWRATSNGLEPLAQSANDSCLILDELRHIDAKILKQTIYSIANGQGKVRARGDGSQRAIRHWALNVISTAEMSLMSRLNEAGDTEDLGLRARWADIPVTTGLLGDAFDHLNGYSSSKAFAEAAKSAVENHHGVVWEAWIKCIVHRDKTRDPDLGSTISMLQIPTDTPEFISRAAKRFVLAYMALYIASENEILPNLSWNDIIAPIRVFDAWAKDAAVHGSERDKSFLQVREWFQAYHSKLISICSDGYSGASAFGYSEFVHGQYLFFVWPEKFRSSVCAGLDHHKVLRDLEERGLLRHDAGRLTKKKRLPHSADAVWMYCISGSILADPADIDT
ncbi:DUF927 domain-containing protein [Pusillimonas sp. ANT_WB101]|uniref:DUF927 domain-containing protein n=1 Tax=Pusillimonas sp. ANT_WB101 TaxID=2597356 RepID=UPI0011F06717|nr:DUF927 domain-containing protein [Pusillimonas sp. ANT_WB101]KAA0910806.1 DUF927 domain-containing protein [Pusillimonas sp. ANT_WB101]